MTFVFSDVPLYFFILVTTDDGVDSVRVCVVLPGLQNKFASKKKAKNADVDVHFGTL